MWHVIIEKQKIKFLVVNQLNAVYGIAADYAEFNEWNLTAEVFYKIRDEGVVIDDNTF
jgi:hypothetical protein